MNLTIREFIDYYEGVNPQGLNIRQEFEKNGVTVYAHLFTKDLCQDNTSPTTIVRYQSLQSLYRHYAGNSPINAFLKQTN